MEGAIGVWKAALAAESNADQQLGTEWISVIQMQEWLYQQVEELEVDFRC